MKEEFKKVMGYARAFITSGEVLGNPESYYENNFFRDITWRFGKCQYVYAVFSKYSQEIVVINGASSNNSVVVIRKESAI